MLINDFLKVCTSFTLHLDFVCDFEEIAVTRSNRAEILEQWDGLKIKSVSLDFDKDGNEVLLVVSAPIECED